MTTVEYEIYSEDCDEVPYPIVCGTYEERNEWVAYLIDNGYSVNVTKVTREDDSPNWAGINVRNYEGAYKSVL